MSHKESQYISIGKIVGVFGLDGTLKIQALTDFPERFSKNSIIFIQKEHYKIKTSFWHKTQVRVKLEGVDTIEFAEKLLGQLTQVPLEDRPKLDFNEFYILDLIGLNIYDKEDKLCGKVEEVIEAPAHHLIRSGTMLIPANKFFVKEINVQKGYIKVELIPGMEEQ